MWYIVVQLGAETFVDTEQAHAQHLWVHVRKDPSHVRLRVGVFSTRTARRARVARSSVAVLRWGVAVFLWSVAVFLWSVALFLWHAHVGIGRSLCLPHNVLPFFHDDWCPVGFKGK